ncbi:MAG: homocysteine S-methyltransferase family protein [Clostridia bacterium]|nr:homocysteine S-methyltransferase family protein [Clostridia bacterium]
MNFRTFLQNNLTILDGGMGTLLQKAGLAPGELPERWNLTHPGEVVAIHRAYFDAGSNVVNTNTFGANCLKFSHDELDDIIRTAVENARTAAAESVGGQEKFVALDIGPTGKMLKPLGDFDFEDAVAVFAETVKLGVKYGADLIMIETMNDSYETKAALLAAKANSDLPVLVSCAFGEDGKLMTGASPAAMVAMLEGMGADAIGVNCSLGPKALAPVVQEYLRLASVPVLLKPNAGLPTVVDGETVYNVGPDEFAREVAALVHDGVRVAGGCCGTTPAYIAALTRQIADMGLIAVPVTPKHDTVVSSYTHAVTFGGDPALIGERINPTGKKRFKQALMEHDIGYILSEGIKQEEAGVDILDVNVGLPEIDEPELLTEAVCELQAVTDLPLQIDTSDPVVMEAALRRYNGKAMINSVNGKEESLRAVLPLVKKYGGVVVALTLDESGIPDTAEGRVQIARRILKAAEAYGIDKKDIIFDTLAMAVSAAPNAANVTLEALSRIRSELGCHTSLGVSNISFGLPARDAVNGTFFAMALTSGLSAAIMNPHSADMMKTYHAYRALRGYDENCAGYIRFAESIPAATPAAVQGSTPSAAKKNTPAEGATPLQKAIIKGLREQSAALTAELIASTPALTVVQTEIIPALDTVGQGFERKTTYLPQLLMAAEAAKAAFEVIKSGMTAAAADTGEPKMPIVLATVKGDIHDIGKNIVKLLLENYGYPVTDLGRDVPPETVVEAAVRLHAPLVGLSALMTTTVPAMEETIKALRKDAPWCKIVVGGAVLTADYAHEIGADKYAADAMETVRYAEELSKRS